MIAMVLGVVNIGMNEQSNVEFGCVIEHWSLKTNALNKRVVVLIWKIMFFLISLFSKLVTYILTSVAIYILENYQ